MNVSTACRLVSATIATGVATLAFAAPASAMVPDPPVTSNISGTTSNTPVDNGTDWAGIATGAAGGIVIVGAGVAAGVALRRRHEHLPHAPA